jgi:hypothetical protein
MMLHYLLSYYLMSYCIMCRYNMLYLLKVGLPSWVARRCAHSGVDVDARSAERSSPPPDETESEFADDQVLGSREYDTRSNIIRDSNRVSRYLLPTLVL